MDIITYICIIAQTNNLLYKKDNKLSINTNNMTKKELIISLIKDDLTYTWLIRGMEKLGFNLDQCYLNLSETIFQLVGFQKDEYEERVFEQYLNLSEKVLSINILEHPEKLTAMANKIYGKLTAEKKLQKQKSKKHGSKK